jgi:hypothetical protein
VQAHSHGIEIEPIENGERSDRQASATWLNFLKQRRYAMPVSVFVCHTHNFLIQCFEPVEFAKG